MKAKVKASLQYAFVLTITAILFWLLFRNVPIARFLDALQTFNYNWIFLSIILSVISHFLRAWRWKLLINSSDNKIRLSTSYYSVMIGYLMNSFFPRLGEISRCGVAYKTDKIPVPFALGTVFTERLIDLIMLLLITAVTLLLQFNLLQDFILDKTTSTRIFLNDNWALIVIAGILCILGLIILLYVGRKKKSNVFGKLSAFVRQGISGILSIGKVRNQGGFWLSTVAIWALYFLMMYVITLGSEITEDLGVLAGLSILVMGSFGMASPTPNGLVTFHAFVAGVLVLYGIPLDDGKIFATILHTSQLITILIIGSISLILVNIRQKKDKIEAQ